MKSGELNFKTDEVITLKDKDGSLYHLEIVQDDNPEDPRDWDNLATMLCWHRDYDLGDNTKLKYNKNAREALKDLIVECDPQMTREKTDGLSVGQLESIISELDNVVYKPLYLYDHSGITISTTSFHDPWDSGQVGFIYLTKKRTLSETMATEENWREKAEKYLDGEVRQYDDYLTCNVWGYKLYKIVTVETRCPKCNELIESYEDEQLIESVYGFYGDDMSENGLEGELGISKYEIIDEK